MRSPMSEPPGPIRPLSALPFVDGCREYASKSYSPSTAERRVKSAGGRCPETEESRAAT